MRYKISILVVSLFVWGNAVSQKLSLGYIYPAGGERGTAVEILIGGLNITDASEVLISGKNVKAEIIPLDDSSQKKKNKNKSKFNDQSSPQLAEKIKVRVLIDKEAIPGLRDLRLKSSKGISNKLSFEVGQYANVMENGISSLQKPNEVSKLPATLCGQIMPGEKDYFSFYATKGTQLVAAAKARILVPYIADAVPGWFQPVMSITNSEGKEIAFDDDFRNTVDPVIITTIPESGTYSLCIYDAIFRGREDFNYRIQIGEIPYLISAHPVAGKVGKKMKITLNGVNLKTETINYKPNVNGVGSLRVLGSNNDVTNEIPFLGAEKKVSYVNSPTENVELIEGEHYYDFFTAPYQLKRYKIVAEKNQDISIVLMARQLGSLLDGKMTLRSASGAVLAQSDDIEDPIQGLTTFHADPVLKYKTKEAGTYFVEVEEVMGNFNKDYFYVLQRVTNLANFTIFVSPAYLIIPKGGTAILKLDIETKEKFTPEMDITLKGLPKGFTTSSLHTQRGTKAWEISVTAPEKVDADSYDLQVSARTVVKGKEQMSVQQSAKAADNMMQAFYYTHHIPAAGFVAQMVPASTFRLHLKSEADAQKPIVIHNNDTVVYVKVVIDRSKGFMEPIELNLNKKMKQISMETVSLSANENEKTVALKLNRSLLDKQRKMRIGLSIVGTVNGQVDQKGKRTFQNAQYKEFTPIFILEKE